MKISLERIETILRSEPVNYVESALAKQLRCVIYKENINLLASFLKKEIEASQISIDKIEKYIEENKNKIVFFGVNLLKNNTPEKLSTGVAITYAIYLIYLKTKKNREFLDYLKRKRIPKAEKFLNQIKNIKIN